MSRGMKKFLPFASLKEQAIFLHEMEKSRQKVDKPLISEDTVEHINDVLTSYHGERVRVYYYDSGFIKKYENSIKKIDVYAKKLIFEDLNILFTNLLNIEIID